MVKLLTFYKHPADEAAFLEQFEAHLVLARRLPHLQQIVVNRIRADAHGGQPSYFMLTEYHFADRQRFREAMESPENQRMGKHLQGFARGLVTLLVAESEQR